MKNKTLWNRNFTIITIGTIITLLGSLLVNFAFSLVVFDETQSTLYSGAFGAVSMIPSIILPLIVAPYMDSHPRRPFIYSLDYIVGIISIVAAIVIYYTGFNIFLYLIVSLLFSICSSIYYTAYQSLYPDLITEGFKQKGYSISSLIYPTLAIIITPISAIIYTSFGLKIILIIQGILFVIAAIFEMFIKIDESHLLKNDNKKFCVKGYLKDLKEGYTYLKKEKGVSNLYIYLAITNATSQGGAIAQVGFFQTSSIFTTASYSIFLAANTLGRVIGGVFQYNSKIKKNHKYAIANTVYKVYSLLDMIVLYLPFPLMLIIQTITGSLGVTSMVLRESAVQQYLPANIRARIQSYLNVLMNLLIMLFKLVAGFLGMFISFRLTVVLLALLSFISSLYFIDYNKKEILKVVNVDC